MQILKKHYRIAIVVVFALLYFAFFSIANDVIEEDAEKIKEASEEELVEVKPADILVTIDNGTTTITYDIRMENQNSLWDVLEELREEYGLTYEILFTTGFTQISEINETETSEGYVWNVYDEQTKIEDFTHYNLDDNNHYYFKYEKK